MQKYRVYKIICDETEVDSTLVYYGSTSKSIETRLKKHQIEKRYYEKCVAEGKKFTRCIFTSWKIIEKTNARIELIRDGLTKYEALKLESVLIEQSPCVNKQLAKRLRTRSEQYHRDKKTRPEMYAKIREQDRKYREKNKDKLRAQKRRKIICECGKSISHGNIAKHRKICPLKKNE